MFTHCAGSYMDMRHRLGLLRSFAPMQHHSRKTNQYVIDKVTFISAATNNYWDRAFLCRVCSSRSGRNHILSFSKDTSYSLSFNKAFRICLTLYLTKYLNYCWWQLQKDLKTSKAKRFSWWIGEQGEDCVFFVCLSHCLIETVGFGFKWHLWVAVEKPRDKLKSLALRKCHSLRHEVRV